MYDVAPRPDGFEDLMRDALDELNGEQRNHQRAGLVEYAETAAETFDDRATVERFVDDLAALLWGCGHETAVETIVDGVVA